MALAKLSPGIVEIRGRFGGVYFKKNPTGQHIQAMPRHVRSPIQASRQKGISCFTNLSNAYAMFKVGEAAAWIAFALAMKAAGYTDLNGRQWFIKKNMNCCMQGKQIEYDPPDFLDPEPFCPKEPD